MVYKPDSNFLEAETYFDGDSTHNKTNYKAPPKPYLGNLQYYLTAFTTVNGQGVDATNFYNYGNDHLVLT